jgi:hypothetical protein
VNWDKHKRPGTDGRAMVEMDRDKSWQSFFSKGGKAAPYRKIVDLEKLAREIRNASN